MILRQAVFGLLAVWIAGMAVSATAASAAENPSRRNPDLLAAFRQAVRVPAKSTVRLLTDDQQVALGTVVDSAGFILTKSSELKGQIECELSDGSRYPAEVVYRDRATDLAMLKIPVSDLPSIQWSTQPAPEVGSWVATPGLDDSPQEIGMISVKPHPVRGGVLGIKIGEDALGPRVGFVIPDSGAAKAGIRLDDVITHVGSQRVKNPDALIAAIKRYLPDQQVELTVRRDGRVFKVMAVLGSEEHAASNERASFQNQLGGPLSGRRSGFLTVLEHDSVLLPNQCGGALVNLDGEAVGINIARASRVSSYAIPASIAKPMAEHMKSKILSRHSDDTPESD